LARLRRHPGHGGTDERQRRSDLPWLGPEKRLIAAAVAADKPYFGACLGAQLLASALGADIYPGPRPEYGMHTVTLSPAAPTDPVFTGLPPQVDVFQWHGETFDLPTGSVQLASSPGFPHQAFRVGEQAYGAQFHVEVSAELLAMWLSVPDCQQEARQELGPDAEGLLTKQVQAAEADMGALAELVFHRWLNLIPG
jgi:GMP synthase (glutamine-hydrolysing)